MKKEDQEIEHLRILCETLFNDPLRPLCIVESDGDIVMQNKAFSSLVGSSEGETQLSVILSRVLSSSDISRFEYTLNTFFILVEKSMQTSASIIDKLLIGEEVFSGSFQPFPNKSGKLCCLVGLSQSGEAYEQSNPEPPSPRELPPVLAVVENLTEKLASINHCEVNLDTSRFNAQSIPSHQSAIILDTLGQILKFSIKHSIESPAERLTLDKETTAHVQLSCGNENFNNTSGVVYFYEDDGRGLNVQEIFECARQANLTDKSSHRELSEDEVVSFLFDDRLSLPTNHNFDVTNLEQLRLNVKDSLNGKIQVSYEEGQSLSIKISVPDKKS